MAKRETVRCRGCGGDLLKETHRRVVKVGAGSVLGVENGDVDFDEGVNPGDTWGYMHETCFLLAVGDPKAIDAIESEKARGKKAAEALNQSAGA